MNKKAIVALKSAWPSVLKKGGWFAIAVGDFERDPERTPLLVVDHRKAVPRAALSKLDREVDLARAMIGRLTISEQGLTFLISEESLVKSPQLMRRAMRQLASHPSVAGIKLNATRDAGYAMDSVVIEDGEVSLDSAEEARLAGDKKKGLLGGRGPYEKLVGALQSWGRKFAHALSPSELDQAERALDKVTKAANAWREKHRTGGKEGRRQEVEHVEQQVARARATLQQARLRLERQFALDALVQGILEPAEDAPPQTPGQLHEAQVGLAERLEATEDPDEKRLITDQIDALARVAEDALKRARDRARPDAPEDQRALALARGAALQARLWRLEELTRPPEALGGRRPREGVNVAQGRRAAGGQLEDQLDAVISDLEQPWMTDELAATLMDDLSAALERLRRNHAGAIADRAAAQLSKLAEKLTIRLVEARAEGVLTETARANLIGSLGRSNEVDAKVRARLVATLGQDLSEDLRRLAAESLGEDQNQPLAGLRDLPAMTRLTHARDQISTRVEQAHRLLIARVVSGATALGLSEQEATAYATARLPRLNLLSEHSRPELPTVEALLRGLVEAHPELGERLELLLEDEDRRADDALAEHDAGRHLGAAGTILEDDVAQTLVEVREQGARTITAIRRVATALLDRLLADPMAVPEPTRRLCVGLHDRAAELPALGQEGARTLLVDTLHLRWIGPALGQEFSLPNPETGLSGSPPTMAGINQLLMFVVTGRVPADELYLPFVDLIRAYIPRYQQFLDRLLEGTRAQILQVPDPLAGAPRSESHDARIERQRSERREALESAEHLDLDAATELLNLQLRDRCATILRQERDRLDVDRAALQRAVLAPISERFRDRAGSLVAPSREDWHQLVRALAGEGQTLCRQLATDAKEGNDNALFRRKPSAEQEGDEQDDDEGYTRDEHWQAVMLPWIYGRVNGALSSHPEIALTAPEDFEREALGPVQEEHARIFDPRRHAEVPRAIAKAVADLRPMLTQVEQVIAAAILSVEETGLTRMGFGRL